MKQLHSNRPPTASQQAAGAVQRISRRGPGFFTVTMVLAAVVFAGTLAYSVLTEGDMPAGSGDAGLRIGATFQDEHTLLEALPGYVIIGSFHVAWPARATHVTAGVDGVDFSVNRAPHSYNGFPGRKFLAINFKTAKPQEMAIVLATKP